MGRIEHWDRSMVSGRTFGLMIRAPRGKCSGESATEPVELQKIAKVTKGSTPTQQQITDFLPF